MIKNLYIKNFVLIDEVQLDFEDGFSSFTGETGAGKSILMDAIGLLRGDKGSAGFVMKDKEKAIVEATFAFDANSPANRMLKELGLETDEDVTFTREIYASGKSVARIDHRVVSLNILKDVLTNEIDIHGQRDNAYLLNAKNHITLLDAYHNEKDLLTKIATKYNVYAALLKQKQEALDTTFNEDDYAYFKHQIEEIEAARLVEGEEEALEEKEKQYHAIKDSLDKFHIVRELFENQVEGDLYTIQKTIASLKPTNTVTTLQENFQTAYYDLIDAIEEILKFQDSMDLDEEEINAMEERLFIIQKLKRKYGNTVAAILAKKEALQEKLSLFENRQTFLEEIDKKIDAAHQEYLTVNKQLHDLRIKKAKELDEAIMHHLEALMLPNAKFKTQITSGKETSIGSDEVMFTVSMNKGEDLKPLQKTASGGELSRLMLGLKVIFTKLQGISTVIFDEIDTGVSGQVAIAIGKKMRQLSRDSQVFSVTHLAPVAACAKHHYYVSKEVKNDATRTSVRLLNSEERIRELAIIASGEITKTTLASGKELLERMQKDG